MFDWDLRELLSPPGWDVFLTDHWQQQPLHVPGEGSNRFAPLVTHADVDRILAAQAGKADFPISVIGSHQGKGVPADKRSYDRTHWTPEHVAERVREGATVRIGNMARYAPEVARLVRAFETVIHTDIAVNLYRTPASSRAFDAHFDNHDVFIIQLDGSKTWRLYDPPRDLPMEVTFPGRLSLMQPKLPFGEMFLPSRPAVELRDEIRMRPGDLLYIPRGFTHQVFTEDEDSLHLTVAAPVITWYEVAAHALIEAAAESRALRTALPADFATAGIDAASQVPAEIAAAVATHLTADRIEASFDELAVRFVNSRQPLVEPGEADPVSLDSVLRIAQPMVYTTQRVTTHIYLLFRGAFVPVPLRCESMLDHMLTESEFRVGDLPTWMDDKSRVLLCQVLVDKGFLEPVP
ncbi:MAG: cupin domain-containing protein [Pseudomonadota bacterium]